MTINELIIKLHEMRVLSGGDLTVWYANGYAQEHQVTELNLDDGNDWYPKGRIILR